MSDLNKLLSLLLTSEVHFVVVGGFAAVLHGSSQVTKDLDICIAMSPDSIAALRKLLEPHHPKHRMTPQKLSFLEYPADISSLKNLYLITDLGVLDVLGFVGGIGEFDDVKKNSIMIELFGGKCRMLSLEALILAKKAMGSLRDLTTARELELIAKKSK